MLLWNVLVFSNVSQRTVHVFGVQYNDLALSLSTARQASAMLLGRIAPWNSLLISGVCRTRFSRRGVAVTTEIDGGSVIVSTKIDGGSVIMTAEIVVGSDILIAGIAGIDGGNVTSTGVGITFKGVILRGVGGAVLTRQAVGGLGCLVGHLLLHYSHVIIVRVALDDLCTMSNATCVVKQEPYETNR